MFKIKTNKNSYLGIGTFLLIVSVCLNIYLYSDMTKLTKDSSKIDDYLKYVIVLKLDRQSDIFYKLGNFVDEINKGSLSFNELNSYLSGIKEFSQNDILHGVNEIIFKDNKELVDILTRITESTAISDGVLEKISDYELNNLKENYYRLSLLLNRNNKNNSLTYYILNNVNNSDLKRILNEINSNLSEIEEILNS